MDDSNSNSDDAGHVEALLSWKTLNEHLRTQDEYGCLRLLECEVRGCYRMSYLLRIQGRLNIVRSARERQSIRAIGLGE
jgi:hypothetical protein